MKESFWAYLIIIMGITSIFFVYMFQSMTNTNEHNYNLLKDTTEAAMYDAIDLDYYRSTNGVVRINREKFVENFIRRFAENATMASEYRIDIYDVNEVPPKVSIKVSSNVVGQAGMGVGSEQISFDIVNKLDAILETVY